jgi:molybdopterin-guanine dinucleotide biosynthesis protein A
MGRLAPLAACAAAALLAGCSAADQQEVTRDAARSAIYPVVAEAYPGADPAPAMECILDNAGSRELLVLAADAVTGATASTAQMVAGIAARPATLTCFAASGLTAPVARI